jgi:hypothetical protein
MRPKFLRFVAEESKAEALKTLIKYSKFGRKSKDQEEERQHPSDKL